MYLLFLLALAPVTYQLPLPKENHSHFHANPIPAIVFGLKTKTKLLPLFFILYFTILETCNPLGYAAFSVQIYIFEKRRYSLSLSWVWDNMLFFLSSFVPYLIIIFGCWGLGFRLFLCNIIH